MYTEIYLLSTTKNIIEREIILITPQIIYETENMHCLLFVGVNVLLNFLVLKTEGWWMLKFLENHDCTDI